MADKIEWEVDAKVNTDQAEKSLNGFAGKVQKGLGGVNEKIGAMGEKFASLPGPIGASASAFMALGKSAMAFVMNPIGAIISAIAIVFMAMYNAMQKTEKGMDALTELTAVFGAFIKPLVKILSDLAVILVEGLASALEFVGELMGVNASEARNLAQELDRLEDQENSLAISRAKQNKELAQARELLSDSNATLQERRKALEQVSKSEGNLAAQELKHRQDTLNALKRQQQEEGENEENKKAIVDATVAVIDAETELAAKRRLFNKESKKLDDEEEARKKEEAAEAKKRFEDAVERQKKWNEERRSAEDKLRDLRNKVALEDITNEEEKAKKTAEIERDNAKREIARSTMTKKEKAEANKLIEKAYQQEIANIEDESRKKKKAKDDEDKKDQEAKDKEALDKKTQEISDASERDKILKQQTITDEQLLADELYRIELKKLEDILAARKAAGVTTIDQEKAIADLTINNNKRVTENQKKVDAIGREALASKLDATKQFFAGVQALAGENSKAAIAAQIGSAVIDTYVAANKALASAPPPFNYIAMAGVIMSGVANVKKIIEESKKIGAETGGSDGGLSAINVGPSISIAGGQAVNSNTQLAENINNAMNKPARSYVVGSDVSSQQSLDRKINQNATLGK